MAPISDEAVHELRATVKKLEDRVQELEGKLSGSSKPPAKPLESIRMVLMGPPGAGGFSCILTQHANEELIRVIRQRHSSATPEGQVLCMPSSPYTPDLEFGGLSN